MVDNPREEILIPPEYSLLETGDGYVSLVQGAIEKEDEEGRQIVEFVIKPTNVLRKRYNIREDQLKDGKMIFQVLKSDLIPLNILDDANRKWLYVKSFGHEETELSKIHWKLREQLEAERRKRVYLEGELIWYSEQLKLARTNPQEFIAQGMEVFEKVGTRMADLMKGKRREDLEE